MFKISLLHASRTLRVGLRFLNLHKYLKYQIRSYLSLIRTEWVNLCCFHNSKVNYFWTPTGTKSSGYLTSHDKKIFFQLHKKLYSSEKIFSTIFDLKENEYNNLLISILYLSLITTVTDIKRYLNRIHFYF